MYRYEQYLDDSRKCGIKKGLASGITTGVTLFLLFCTYILGTIIKCNHTIESYSFCFVVIGFRYGAKLIREENYTIGKVFIVS
jgi:hypothetical protein